MAGESPLLSMLGGTDLSAFSQTALQNNLFAQLAPSILNAKFDTSTWNPGTSAAVSFGKALLGGLANNYGHQQVADQTNAVTSLLPSLYSNPLAVNAPEGADSEAFANIKNRAVADSLLRTAAEKATKEEYANKIIGSLFEKNAASNPDLLNKLKTESSIFKDANTSGFETTGFKNDALLNTLGITDPKVREGLGNASEDTIRFYVKDHKDATDADLEKVTSRLTKDLERKTSAYQAAINISPILDNVDNYVTALKAGSPANPQSDLNLIDSLAKVVNPGGILRAQFIDQIGNAQNPLNAFSGEINKVFGGGQFNDGTRQQIVDVIKRQGHELLNSGKSYLDNKLAVARNSGLKDTGNIISQDYYDSIFGRLQNNPVNSINNNGLPGIGSMFNGQKVLSIKKIS